MAIPIERMNRSFVMDTFAEKSDMRKPYCIDNDNGRNARNDGSLSFKEAMTYDRCQHPCGCSQSDVRS